LIVYPDSSFLFSWYLPDQHSQEVDRRMLLRPSLYVTPFHRAELANAIFQWAFRGTISSADAQLAYANFERDCSSGVFTVTEQPDQVFSICVALARRHVVTLGVRTLDSLHVAAALELKADVFWTFDERQKRLAEAEGLATA
jgi:predicted nucleic acid-binding protein